MFRMPHYGFGYANDNFAVHFLLFFLNWCPVECGARQGFTAMTKTLL